MTIGVDVHYPDGTSDHVVPSTSALETVRYRFNPDQLKSVRRVHVLAAAFITACEEFRNDGASDGRQAAHSPSPTPRPPPCTGVKSCTTAEAVKRERETRDYAAEQKELDRQGAA